MLKQKYSPGFGKLQLFAMEVYQSGSCQEINFPTQIGKFHYKEFLTSKKVVSYLKKKKKSRGWGGELLRNKEIANKGSIVYLQG